MRIARIVTASFLALLLAPCSRAAAPQHWVGTWGASPVALPNSAKLQATDTTLRETVHLSLGGSGLRLIFTNEFGTEPLTIAKTSVALSPSTSAHGVTFDGKPGIEIPAGARILSDPVAMTVPPLADLTVTFFMPGQTISVISQHSLGLSTNFIADGDQVDAATMTAAQNIPSWRFLRGVDVLANGDAATIVTLGDSITDGAQSTPGANARWPDVLARRLQADKKLSHLGVLNEGIGGNRVLHDVTGPSALARFDRDVLAQDGVKYLVILESINDIGRAGKQAKAGPVDPVTADQLIAAMKQMIDRAHLHGIKVYGATLLPYMGAFYSTPEGETMREAVNTFIRTGGAFDGVIDFEKVIADPANPTMFLPAFNLKDHLHPNDAGYKAMGDSIDLKLFTK